LDEDKLTLLRRWGEGLTLDEREEVRAAGRAILLLSDEIERLHIDLWHAGDRASVEEEPETSAHESRAPEPAPAEEGGLGVTLRERLAMFRPSKATDR
jgi:hypothetical protein